MFSSTILYVCPLSNKSTFLLILSLIISTDENFLSENSLCAKVFSFNDISSGDIKLLKCHPAFSKISIFRLDIENALNATIDSYIKTENFFKNSYIKNIGKHNLIKKGILGTKGDIVVDDVEKPKRVIGLCGNDGLLQNISFKKLKILHKNITKKNKL